MATRKASDSNLTGKKYNDASAGGTKIPDLPEVPTSVSATTSDSPSITFTAPLRGGAVNNFVVENDFNNTTHSGATSPISATGFTPGTSLRFRVKSVNNSGQSGFSSYTNSVGVTGWFLSQTFNSTGNYTVPANTTKLAVIVVGGGASGGGGDSGGDPPSSGGGGSGSSAGAFTDYSVNAGTTYAVTVGAANGNSSFGNLLTAGPNGTATSNVGGATLQARSLGGNINNNSYNSAPNAGAASAGPISLTIGGTVGNVSLPYGGGGGAASFIGGGGSNAGGSPYGGVGRSSNQAQSGGAANGIGGGGGGAKAGAGGMGGSGVVYVYAFG
jgi:hypothetical protein